MEHLLAHNATHYRKTDSGSEYGTPQDPVLTAIGSFKCRLSLPTGFESPSPRSGQREQTRSGKMFLMYDAASLQRGDRIRFDHVPGMWEVEFHMVAWDYGSPHHWEVDVVYVEGT